jgi:phage terminase small subunit
MRPDEFVETELLKAVKRRKALEEIAPQSEDEAHIEFLKNLTIQQTSSLPLTVMHDILYNQIQIVAKLCQKYTKMMGLSSSVTKVAVAHYNLMQKHLQIFHFMGLRTMPPLYIVRKYEEEPKEENSAVTSSSSSEYAEELEDFFEDAEEVTVEQLKERQLQKEEENLLAGKAAGAAEAPSPVTAP